MDLQPDPTTTVLVFATRKPGTTFAQFKSYYESTHVPLVTRLVLQNDLRPLSYTRNYIERDDGGGSFPFGGAEEWEYDCVARVVFRDVEHRDALFERFEECGDEIARDEERFLDRAKLRVVFVSEGLASVRKD